jgi:hypothetical protein
MMHGAYNVEETIIKRSVDMESVPLKAAYISLK